MGDSVRKTYILHQRPILFFAGQVCPAAGRKEKNYAEYRRSRKEMRELLTAKANVDRLMGYGEERQNDREKEPEQDR